MTVNATTMIPSGTSAASGIAAWSSGCAKLRAICDELRAQLSTWPAQIDNNDDRGYAYDGHDTTYLGYPAWWLTEVGYMNGTAQPCDTPTGTC